MGSLLFRITPRQLRGLRISTLALVVITVVLAAIAHLRRSEPILVYAIAAAGTLPLILWINVTSAWAFTECSREGIRARGLFGVGVRNCRWADVSDIRVVTERTTTTIMVTRHDGSRFRLGVPRDSVVMADRDLRTKFARIATYWHAKSGC